MDKTEGKRGKKPFLQNKLKKFGELQIKFTTFGQFI